MSKTMNTNVKKNNQPALQLQPAGEGEIVFFNNQDGTVNLDVQTNSGNVWLRQELIADLFSKDPEPSYPNRPTIRP